jgi:asparagine synthase (glutamine-hydrolysing)
LAAKRYGTLHEEVTISGLDFLKFLPEFVRYMEEPVCEPPGVALYFVSRVARESGVKVLLSGEGGDEAFGGYQTYRNFMLLERLKSLLGPARPVLRRCLQGLSRVGWTRFEPYCQCVDGQVRDYYLSRSATPQTLFNRMKPKLYTSDFFRAIGGGDGGGPTRDLFERVEGKPFLHQMLYVDTKTWLPDDLLVKADKMTMATSVELRVPLLDFQVLEFAASLPEQYKVQGASTKRILKAALQESVPREILTRKKTGFPIPYARWLRTTLEGFVRDSLTSPSTTLTTYFREKAISQTVTDFYRYGFGQKEVFCLLLLDLWHRQFAGTQDKS